MGKKYSNIVVQIHSDWDMQEAVEDRLDDLGFRARFPNNYRFEAKIETYPTDYIFVDLENRDYFVVSGLCYNYLLVDLASLYSAEIIKLLEK